MPLQMKTCLMMKPTFFGADKPSSREIKWIEQESLQISSQSQQTFLPSALRSPPFLFYNSAFCLLGNVSLGDFFSLHHLSVKRSNLRLVFSNPIELTKKNHEIHWLVLCFFMFFFSFYLFTKFPIAYKQQFSSFTSPKKANCFCFHCAIVIISWNTSWKIYEWIKSGYKFL